MSTLPLDYPLPTFPEAVLSRNLAARRFERPMQSPCIKVCAIDTATGLCAGCGRSLAEIGSWATMTDEERRRIMSDLPARQEAARAATAR